MFGLDLGNYTSSLASVAGTGADVLPNTIGNRTPPTAVGYGAQKRFLAEDAIAQRNTNWRNTFVGLPSLLGRCGLATDAAELAATESGGDGVRVNYRNSELTVAAEAIVGAYIGGMVHQARGECGGKDPAMVFAVPSCFSEVQRLALHSSAVIAGAQRVQLCDETVATALFYAHDRLSGPACPEASSAVMFVDAGHNHTTMFVAAFDCESRTLCVVDSEVVMVGGRDFDALLASKFEADFLEAKGVKITSDRARLRLLAEAEKAKEVLSANSSWEALMEELQDGLDFKLSATRDELKALGDEVGLLFSFSPADHLAS